MHSLTLVSSYITNYLINVHAQLIPVTVPWDASLFAEATVAHRVPEGTPLHPASKDSNFMSRFPTPELGPFKKPTTLVDCHGRILVWYLPGILNSTANVRCIIDLNLNYC